ncbi:MAG: FKBP-type peptidyl-prolyl cis-trans isomerase [Sphingobacteriales bacterium]
MKPTIILTFFLIAVLGLASCRKDKTQLTIKQYDNQQILNYIAANGLTGMKRDLTGGDTTGIYYQIINPGTKSIDGTPFDTLDYPSQVTFVYTERTLDGTFVSSDTINNHFFNYVGHITNSLPLGLRTAVHNLLKYPGASMRVLIPSHLAYGINGVGSGSSQVSNNRIAGNESMDFYVHAVNDFQVYDDQVINSYMTANGLTGYTKVKMQVPIPVGTQLNPLLYWAGKNSNPATKYSATYYYKILTSATTNDPITDNSTITATYTGQLFNGVIFDQSYNGTTVYTGGVSNFIAAVRDGLENTNIKVVAGTKISLLIPSALAYGIPANSSIPPFSCLRFTWQILTVTP